MAREPKPTPAQAALILYFGGGETPQSRGVRTNHGTYHACRRNKWITEIDAFPFHKSTRDGLIAIDRADLVTLDVEVGDTVAYDDPETTGVVTQVSREGRVLAVHLSTVSESMRDNGGFAPGQTVTEYAYRFTKVEPAPAEDDRLTAGAAQEQAARDILVGDAEHDSATMRRDPACLARTCTHITARPNWLPEWATARVNGWAHLIGKPVTVTPSVCVYRTDAVFIVTAIDESTNRHAWLMPADPDHELRAGYGRRWVPCMHLVEVPATVEDAPVVDADCHVFYDRDATLIVRRHLAGSDSYRARTGGTTVGPWVETEDRAREILGHALTARAVLTA